MLDVRIVEDTKGGYIIIWRSVEERLLKGQLSRWWCEVPCGLGSGPGTGCADGVPGEADANDRRGQRGAETNHA
ncbi:unnamed protein product, partial [Symbiodinium pilosum]